MDNLESLHGEFRKHVDWDLKWGFKHYQPVGSGESGFSPVVSLHSILNSLVDSSMASESPGCFLWPFFLCGTLLPGNFFRAL